MRKNEEGQNYEDLDGERETGDGDGDQKFVLDECLSSAEIEAMLSEALNETSEISRPTKRAAPRSNYAVTRPVMPSTTTSTVL